MKNAILVIAGFFLLLSCGSSRKMLSSWTEKPIEIKGASESWNNEYAYFGDEKLLIGAKNDKDFLYLSIKTNDRANIRKILAHGFTLWINNEECKDKSFGVHYPLGFGGRAMKEMKDADFNPEMDGKPEDSDNQSDRAKRPKFKNEELSNNIEFLKDDGKLIQKSFLEEAKNKYKINLNLVNDPDGLNYEIAIPLKSELIPYAKNPNKTISIGLESGEFKMPDRENMPKMKGGGEMGGGGMQGGGMSGGRGGMGGGGRGGMRGGQHGSSDEMKTMSEPLKVWIDIKLGEKNEK